MNQPPFYFQEIPIISYRTGIYFNCRNRRRSGSKVLEARESFLFFVQTLDRIQNPERERKEIRAVFQPKEDSVHSSQQRRRQKYLLYLFFLFVSSLWPALELNGRVSEPTPTGKMRSRLVRTKKMKLDYQ